MRATGIIRRIDDLGRIVIPRAVRQEVYGTANTEGKPMEIFYEKNGTIILKPYEPMNEDDKGDDVDMNRIDRITQFAQKKEQEKLTKEQERLRQIEEYKANIRELKPRIDELLSVGNACLEHDIALTGKAWGGHEGYDTHQFITNSWSHLLGFVSAYDREARRNMPFTKLGIYGGGACNYNLETDGNNINVTGDVLYILKRFVSEFDTFEREFYKYVDDVTK